VPPGNSATTRPAESTDADALLSLASSFATSFTVDAERFATQLAALLADPTSALAVAVIDGDVVGYVAASLHPTLYANGPVAWIEELMVHPARRRAGVGQSLVATVERWASARGAVMVSLATRRASAFWSAAGFEASATYFRKVL
jgi:GNAT superfamily N-acetyltransferase